VSIATQQRWCHACCRVENFDLGWYEVWIGSNGECVVQPVSDPTDYHKQFRGDIFACGQLSALVLVERYLHKRSFDPATAEFSTLATVLTEHFAQL
jgi:hypothetical protein